VTGRPISLPDCQLSNSPHHSFAFFSDLLMRRACVVLGSLCDMETNQVSGGDEGTPRPGRRLIY
jgi:hypothetical protein